MTTGRNEKTFTRAEVANHNNSSDCWVIIGNKVYDVTRFLDEHPGGLEVLLEKAGEDRTEAFEDIGHSTDARQMREDYFIGQIVGNEHWKYSYDQRAEETDKKTDEAKKAANFSNPPWEMLVYTLLLAICAGLLYYLLLA